MSKELENAESGDLEAAIKDLEYFRDEMYRLHEEGELSDSDYLDLLGFVNTIITHITNGNKNEGRLVKIMGGTVIETESERLINIGKEEGKLDILFEMVKDNILTVSEAAARADITEEFFLEKMKAQQCGI
jgi:predicted helicase